MGIMFAVIPFVYHFTRKYLKRRRERAARIRAGRERAYRIMQSYPANRIVLDNRSWSMVSIGSLSLSPMEIESNRTMDFAFLPSGENSALPTIEEPSFETFGY